MDEDSKSTASCVFFFVSRWRRKQVTWHSGCWAIVWGPGFRGHECRESNSLVEVSRWHFLSLFPACSFDSEFLVQWYICGITRCPRSQICVNLRRVGRSWTAREIMFVAREIPAEHKDLIHDVSYDYHGRRMATCSSDQSVKVRISHYICKFPVRSTNAVSAGSSPVMINLWNQ